MGVRKIKREGDCIICKSRPVWSRRRCRRCYDYRRSRGKERPAIADNLYDRGLPLRQRLAARTNKSRGLGPKGTCWEWTKYTVDGYGRMKHAGRDTLATHLVWLVKHGKLPCKGQMICHTCDNRKCVRISHLYLGNAKSNTQDAIARDRLARGERSGSAKLTEDAVRCIRSRAQRESRASLGREFGVDASVISGIIKRRYWTHI